MKMYCVSYRNSNIFQYVVAYENGGSFIQYKDIPILFDKEKANEVAKNVIKHMNNFSDVVVKIHEVNIDSGKEVKEELRFNDLKVGEVFTYNIFSIVKLVKISKDEYICVEKNPPIDSWKYKIFKQTENETVKRVKTN
jgi:hypothetical protein